MNHKNVREEYYKNPLVCGRCGAVIPFEKRRSKKSKRVFCSNSCSVLTTNKEKYTDEVIKRMSDKAKINQKRIWTTEKRKEHSLKMKNVVNQNPDSYSRYNVCGRVKPIKIVDSYGNETKCLGKWELLVVEYLNKKGIKWTNKIDEIFEYQWNNSVHRYFPDFKTDKGFYIEVKGFERDRDRAKWKNFPHKLVVIKEADIKKIKAGEFDFFC